MREGALGRQKRQFTHSKKRPGYLKKLGAPARDSSQEVSEIPNPWGFFASIEKISGHCLHEKNDGVKCCQKLRRGMVREKFISLRAVMHNFGTQGPCLMRLTASASDVVSFPMYCLY